MFDTARTSGAHSGHDLPTKRLIVYTRGDGTAYVEYVETARMYRHVRRWLDIIVTSGALISIAPLMALLALLIRITSPGPALFRQERVGRGGRSFMMLRFRTMYEGAERSSGPVWSVADDPRRTSFGQLLRRLNLDVLPTLWNVLRGDMSLIGPRAERPFFLDQIKQRMPPSAVDAVLTLRPGVISFSTLVVALSARTSPGFSDAPWRYAAELYYLQRLSPTLDARVMLASVFWSLEMPYRLGLPTVEQLSAHLFADELEREAVERQFCSETRFTFQSALTHDTLAAAGRMFDEAHRFIVAANQAFSSYHKRRQIAAADERINHVFTILGGDAVPGSEAMWRAATTWQSVLTGRRRQIDLAAPVELPNPFLAGEPLTPEFGREVFRGREPVVRMIEGLLSDPARATSVVIIGPRRCGKTSLLRMLPALLPSVYCVFFDLQDNPVSNPSSFVTSLVRRVQEQIGTRRITVPELSLGSADGWLEQASAWFEHMSEALSSTPLLICVDEFERLEALWPGDDLEMRQFLSLVRSTIQHRRNIKFLLCGEAPFEELRPIWTDTFINARQLRLSYIERGAGTQLLRRPVDDYADWLSEPLAGAIYDCVGGQPYLLQLYGSLLVDHLNQTGRTEVCNMDIDEIEERVLLQAGIYFRQVVRTVPSEARAVLVALANGSSVSVSAEGRRWLARRGLLSTDGVVAIPVMARWIREEWDETTDTPGR